jgi:uncharacterized damage-inducible protein DinB
MSLVLRNALLGIALCLAVGCAPAPEAVEAPAPNGAFRDEVVSRIEAIETKVVGLAEAMSQEQYAWRPAEGVRSVGELYGHIAGANFGLSGLFGAPAPEGAAPGADVTDKAQIVAALTASFAHLKGAVGGVPAADAESTMNMFGQEMTTRQALVTLTEHLSEHLGQGIAYARVNGVVPPWNQ